ncbi:MAG TPA: DUF2207 domain-containing protein [bacterium]|nr:DUF2207 domain-containing protein [bacterium]
MTTKRSVSASVIAALLLFPAALFAKAWSIDEFDSRIEVHPDSSLTVTETITLRFEGEYNGIYRSIPYKYTGPYGTALRLRIKIDGVTDGAGASLKHTVSGNGPLKDIKIWVPGAVDAVRTVKVAYRVSNALLYFNDHDELYWNVTGNEWPVPIARARAKVILPPGVKDQRVNYTAYTGELGSTAKDCRAELSGSEIIFETTDPLTFKEGLTIVCGWPKGIVTPISASTKIRWFLTDNWYIFLPFAILALMVYLWLRTGRDPESGRSSIMPQYEPPKGATPAEVGTIIDEKVDMRDISATVVDLAVRGYLRIREEESKGLIFSSKDFRFTFLKPGHAADPGLRKHETEILNGIFGNGTEKKLSELTNKFYTHIPAIKDALYSAMVTDGYFSSRPDGTRTLYIGVGIFVAALGFATIPLTAEPNVALIVCMILSGAIIAIFAPLMPRKTKKGAEALWHIKGFEEYLSRAEKDRLKLDTPETFEKLLPYAMALGVAEQWASAFKEICREQPEWYEGAYGGSPFDTMVFMHSLNSMNRTVATTFVSAPRSSSGASGGHSGFGGGGFSGGGFGGGGGRAW